MSPLPELARFAAGVAVSDVPVAALESARLHLLDTIGCAIAASGLDRATAGRTLAAERGGRPLASVIGLPERVAPESAALANGMLAHALDFDDSHSRARSHLSSVICPAALAAGEAASASGEELLAALVVGYEVASRLGIVAGNAFHRRGFHPTSVLGLFGAVAAVGRLRGSDATRLTAALTVAGSMASGILECVTDGSTVKPLHSGWAAAAALTATDFARLGLTGPGTVLDGRYGLYAAYAGLDGAQTASALAAEVATLGTTWESTQLAVKPYPACRFVHSCVAAGEQLLEAYPELRTSPPVAVEVTVPEAAVPIVLEPVDAKQAPRTGYAAQFSLQYTMAVLFVSGTVELTSYGERWLADDRVRALAGRVTYRTAPYPQFPSCLPGAVTVTTASGDRVSREVIHEPGSHLNPMAAAEIVAKFRGNLSSGGVADTADAWLDALDSIGSAPDLEQIAGLTRTTSPGRAS
jgi:2-methylcitrate dehydratase PrpD